MRDKIDTIHVRPNHLTYFRETPYRLMWKVCVTTTKGRSYFATWANCEEPTREEITDAWKNSKRADWLLQ